jgi:hypothetical protein
MKVATNWGGLLNMTETGATILFAALLASAPCYAAFVYWRTYIAYKLLGDRVEKLGFLWFSFQFQLPEFSKGMAMYVDYFDALPNELKGRTIAIRREINIARLIVVAGLLFLIFSGLIFKYLKARGYI